MINLIANSRYKALGAKWNGNEWTAPELAQNEFDQITKKFYEDLIVVEITLNKDTSRLNGVDWNYQHVRTIAGYIVASAKSRDGGARVTNGVAVLKGSFSSGGSQKNYMCTYTEDLVLRMKVSRHALDILEEEATEKKFSVRVLEEEKTRREKLLEEKKILSERLEHIQTALKVIDEELSKEELS